MANNLFINGCSWDIQSFDVYQRAQDPTLKFIDFVGEIVKLHDMYSFKNKGKETSQVRFQLPEKNAAKVPAIRTGNNSSQELSLYPKHKSFTSEKSSPLASPSRKGSLSPNWRERDSKCLYYPNSGSLTSILNSSIDQMGTSMKASTDRIGNSIGASILDMSTAVGKSLEKNSGNWNKQFDSLVSGMDSGFQSITQLFSDIRVVSPERSRKNSGNNYAFSARSGSQSQHRDQTSVFIVMNLVIFKQLVLSAHQGDSTDQRLHLSHIAIIKPLVGKRSQTDEGG